MALRTSSQGRSRRRNGLALAASLGAHLAVLGLILGSASGDLVPSGDNVGNGSGGGAGEPLMTVSLVDPTTQMSSAAPDASAAASAAVADLFKRLAVAPTPQAAVFVSPQDQAKTSLDEILGKAQAKGGGSQPGQSQAQQAAGLRKPDGSPQAGPARTGATASSGSLFGLIEPCWRKQPGVSRVLVKLELTLGGDGRLALPPKIIRTSQMVLNDQQFFAEARALSALKACLPLRTGAPTGVQQVEFRPDASARR